MPRNVSLIAKRFLVCSLSPEQMEWLSKPNFLLIVADPDTSQPTSTDSSNSVNYLLPLFFLPVPLFLSFSISRCLSFNTLAHIRCRTYKRLTMAGKFTVVMKLSGGLSYIGALPQARQPIACGHYLSACRLHRLRYLYD